MRSEPNARVLAWLDKQSALDLQITAITVAELKYGIARLPNGKRKAGLQAGIEMLLANELADRVLPFDEHSANHYATLVAGRERSGRPISSADAQIAAICRSRDALLATGNVKDFDATGISIIDPWLAT